MGVVFSVALTLALGAVACGKSNTSPDGNSGSSGGSSGTNVMTATIDGVAWRSTTVTANYSPAESNVGASILNLAGGDSPLTQTLGFAVGARQVGTALTTGTYDIGGLGGTNARLEIGFLQGSYQAVGNNGSGSVTLTSFSTASKTAAGTFNFVLVPVTGNGASKRVTNGTFTVTFK